MLEILSNNILTRAFWGDEAWTTLISSLPIGELIKTTAADFHPPLYYLITHFWMLLFGNTEVSIRMLSLVFWIATGAAAYFLAKAWHFSKSFSFLAAAFVLFNPFFFSFAFEARSYSLFVFLTLVSMWQFYQVLTKDEGRRFTDGFYLLFSIAGLYTHYYMFFVVAAQYLLVLALRRDLIKKFFGFGVIFFLAYVPWLPSLLAQGKSVAGGYWIPPVDLGTISGTLTVLVRGEQDSVFFRFIPPIFLGFLLLAGAIATSFRKLLTKETIFLALWLVIPFCAPLIVSLYRPIFFYRYFVFLTVPLMMAPLYFLASTKLDLRVKFPVQVLLPSVVLAIYLWTDVLMFMFHNDQLFKAVLRDVHGSVKKGQVIYTALPSFAEVVYYNDHDGRPLPVRVLPTGLQQASGKALLDTYVRLGCLTLENPPEHGQYWLLEPGPTYWFLSK